MGEGDARKRREWVFKYSGGRQGGISRDGLRMATSGSHLSAVTSKPRG